MDLLAAICSRGELSPEDNGGMRAFQIRGKQHAHAAFRRLSLDLFKRKAMLVCSCKQPLSWAKHDSQYTSRLCFASSSLPKSKAVHFVNQYFCLLIMAPCKVLPITP